MGRCRGRRPGARRIASSGYTAASQFGLRSRKRCIVSLAREARRSFFVHPASLDGARAQGCSRASHPRATPTVHPRAHSPPRGDAMLALRAPLVERVPSRVPFRARSRLVVRRVSASGASGASDGSAPRRPSIRAPPPRTPPPASPARSSASASATPPSASSTFSNARVGPSPAPAATTRAPRASPPRASTRTSGAPTTTSASTGTASPRSPPPRTSSRPSPPSRTSTAIRC